MGENIDCYVNEKDKDMSVTVANKRTNTLYFFSIFPEFRLNKNHDILSSTAKAAPGVFGDKKSRMRYRSCCGHALTVFSVTETFL